MKSLKVVLGIAITAVGVSSVAVVGAVNNKTSLVHADGNTRVVNFATANITRRFFFVIEEYNSSWAHGQEFYVHIWNGDKGTLTADNGEIWSGAASIMYGDYGKDNQGLWYVDITGVGVGNNVYAQVKRQNGSDAWSYSSTVLIPSLADKTYDVIWLYDEGLNGNRKAELHPAGGTIDQVASFLNFYDTCENSYANGYNAYPQLDANFLNPSSSVIGTSGNTKTITDKDGEGNDQTYTVNQKINQINDLYDTLGWTVA